MATLGKIAARDAVDTGESNLSFAGYGFNSVNHIGAALHLRRHKIGDSSEGAMCALALLCDIPLVSGRPHQEACNALPEG